MERFLKINVYILGVDCGIGSEVTTMTHKILKYYLANSLHYSHFL